MEALALLSPAAARAGTRLVIVGNGVERGYLERRAGELGLSGRILFTGQQENVSPFMGLRTFLSFLRTVKVLPTFCWKPWPPACPS